jgi:hypothetical protein
MLRIAIRGGRDRKMRRITSAGLSLLLISILSLVITSPPLIARSAPAATEAHTLFLPLLADARGRTLPISVTPDGSTGNGPSYTPAVNADGQTVAFYSFANDLVPGDDNNWEDVFVYERLSGTMSRVSISSGGVQGNHISWDPAISGDGQIVVFSSFADNLAPGDTNGTWDIFVHNRGTGITGRVSVASDGTQGNSFADRPRLSADGNIVAFFANASNLVSGDSNGWSDVFVHDRSTGVTERVSVGSNGEQSDGFSGHPALTADGLLVAFVSAGSTLVPQDTNNASDIFVHDRVTGVTTRVSLAWDGSQANGQSRYPALSGNGRFLAYESQATNLVPHHENNWWDIFLYDRLSGNNAQVSVASNGAYGNTDSEAAAVDAGGVTIVFHSLATNLIPGDDNGYRDVFVRTLLASP